MTTTESRHPIRPLLSALLAGLALAALLPIAWPSDPLAIDLSARLAAPSPAHLLGCDALGRDLLARLVYGARLSLGTGALVIASSLAIGVLVGGAAAWAGGWVDALIGRTIDVLLAFPGLLLAILFAAMRGPGTANVVIALSLLGWTGYARLTRAEVRRWREREFTQAAQALGASATWILRQHLLPAAAPALAVQAVFGLSSAIVAEASLSFLGVGLPPPAPSWGAMLEEARPFLLVAPRLTIAPGLCLAAIVLGIHGVGDVLRRRLGSPER